VIVGVDGVVYITEEARMFDDGDEPAALTANILSVYVDPTVNPVTIIGLDV
jgi:hypothetical protein